MNEPTINLSLNLELAQEILMALRARQRATGSCTPGFKLCEQAIAEIEAALESPDLNGKTIELLEGSGY